MAFVPAPNCARATLIYNYNDEEVQNSFYYQRTEPYDVGDMNSLAGILADWWETNMIGFFNVTSSLQRIEVVALDTEFAPGIVYTSGLPILGGEAIEQNMPANVTVCVKWVTALRGKSYRGRTYHVGLNSTFVIGNRVAAPIILSLQAKYTTLGGVIGGANPHTHVVVSTRHNNADRLEAVVTPIQSCYIEDWVDSQRRRLHGRGT